MASHSMQVFSDGFHFLLEICLTLQRNGRFINGQRDINLSIVSTVFTGRYATATGKYATLRCVEPMARHIISIAMDQIQPPNLWHPGERP